MTTLAMIPERGFARPLKLALLFSILGEAALFLVYGVVLYPEGSWFIKFMWAVVYCGVGMGGAVGAVIALGVLGRFEGWRAIAMTTLAMAVILGGFCNILCLRLDMTFGYFGGKTDPVSFAAGGLLPAILGGALLGWLTFTERGRAFGPDWLK